MCCAVLALAVIISGCSYSPEEPGLFRQQSADSPSPTSSREPGLPPRPTNPELPVAGQAVWSTGEGLRVTVRFAVHAVRRIQGATVLDWSVTPLTGRGLAVGDALPDWIDLGLTRPSGGDVNIVLIDTAHRRVYHPLSHQSRSEFRRCLCSPIWLNQLSLRLGETRMLQLTFPELPAGMDFVDVQLANVAPFWHVPVTPLGMAPTATAPTDLGRPAEQSRPVSRPHVYRYPPGESRRQSISINRIVATPGETVIDWTMHSITDQPSIILLVSGPPMAAALPENVLLVDPNAVSGPELRPVQGDRPEGARMRVQFMTARVEGDNFYECLCSSIGLWAASLRQAGGSASGTTTFGPLPAGVSAVDVVLQGVATLTRLPVVRAADSAASLGRPTAAKLRTWTYAVESPPRGWSTWDWPTPTPDPSQLGLYNSFVEDIVQLPGW
jgi:hypothetical protein